MTPSMVGGGAAGTARPEDSVGTAVGEGAAVSVGLAVELGATVSVGSAGGDVTVASGAGDSLSPAQLAQRIGISKVKARSSILLNMLTFLARI